MRAIIFSNLVLFIMRIDSILNVLLIANKKKIKIENVFATRFSNKKKKHTAHNQDHTQQQKHKTSTKHIVRAHRDNKSIQQKQNSIQNLYMISISL